MSRRSVPADSSSKSEENVDDKEEKNDNSKQNRQSDTSDDADSSGQDIIFYDQKSASNITPRKLSFIFIYHHIAQITFFQSFYFDFDCQKNKFQINVTIFYSNYVADSDGNRGISTKGLVPEDFEPERKYLNAY